MIKIFKDFLIFKSQEMRKLEDAQKSCAPGSENICSGPKACIDRKFDLKNSDCTECQNEACPE